MRVKLPPGSGRGGVATQAGVLTVTSHPKRTSPVLRGKFVIEKLFNRPPPNPPDDVPALNEAAVGKAPKSLREQMARHASDPTARLPQEDRLLGADAGRVRRDRGGPAGEHADVSAPTPDGQTLVGADGLRKELLRRKDEFARGLAEQLTLYALGRTLDGADKAAVSKVVAKAAADGYKMRTLVQAVVASDPFQKR